MERSKKCTFARSAGRPHPHRFCSHILDRTIDHANDRSRRARRARAAARRSGRALSRLVLVSAATVRARARRCLRRRRVRSQNGVALRGSAMPRCRPSSMRIRQKPDIISFHSHHFACFELGIHSPICSVKSLAKPAAGVPSSASASASASASTSAASAFKIKIFYGSQSGTAEGFARQLKKEAVRYGVAAVVQDLETYTPVSLHVISRNFLHSSASRIPCKV